MKAYRTRFKRVWDDIDMKCESCSEEFKAEVYAVTTYILELKEE